MRQYILLALLGLALANVPPYPWDEPSGISEWDDYSAVEKEVYTERDIKEEAFRPGQQYKYFYDGQIMNGFPRSSKQHSATRIQAVVKIEMESQDTMLMQLKHIRIGRLNRRVLDPRHALPFRFFHPVPIDQKFRMQLEMPVKFQYVDGMVKNIYFESDDVPEVTNIKRGILNLIQVNLKEHRSVETDEQRLTNVATPELGRSKFYRVMEPTIEGECETQYTVVKQPMRYHRVLYEHSSAEDRELSIKPRLNVTKSINFEKCKRRPEVKYNYRNVQPCQTSDPKYLGENKALKSSSIIKFNLIGNRQTFLVETAKAESQHTFEFYNEEGSYVNVYVNQTLKLFKTGEISKPIQQSSPRSVETELVYTQEWDRLNEKLWMEGEKPEKDLRNKPTNFIEEVTTLLKKLAHSAARVSETPVSALSTSQYTLLVAALRKADYDDLKKIHELVYKSPSSLSLNKHETKFLQDIVEPAVASCGTQSAMRHLLHVIKEKSIDKYVAVTTLRQLPNARVVSMTIVNQMKSLCEETHVQHYAPLKRTCYLSLGSLMHAACSNQHDKLAVDAKSTTSTRCTISQKKELVQLLINKLKEENKWEDKVLYLKSLGNAGLDVSILELEKIIRNTEQYYPEYVRHEAIVAMRKIATIMPHRVQKTLMSIFMNPREPTALRTLASHFILVSHPERTLLDTMAKQINTEPYRQVATYTYQLMNQIANSTAPCDQRVADDLKLALRFVRHVNPSLYDSKSYYTTFYSIMRKTGINMDLFELVANNTLVPKAIGGVLGRNTFGYNMPNILYWSVVSEGLESMIPKFWQADGTFKWSLSDILSRQQRSVNGRQLLRDIFDKLKIHKRSLPRTLKTYLEWGMLGELLGFHPLGEEWTEYISANGIVSKIEKALRSDKMYHVNWHHASMLQDTQLKIPTLIGLPLIVKHKMPVVVKVEGTLKSKMTGTWDQIEIDAHLRPSIAVKQEHTVEFWCPVAASGVRVRGSVRLHLPLAGKVKLDVPTKELKIEIQQPTITKELVRIESQPITFTRQPFSQLKMYHEASEKVVEAEEINRVQLVDKYITGMGMEFHIKNRYTPMCNQPQNNYMAMSPLAGRNKISIRALKPRDNTKKIELKIKLEGSYRKEEPLETDLLKAGLSESESESLSSEEMEPGRFTTTHHRYGSVVVELATKGGSQERKYQATLKTSGSMKGRFGKLEGKIARVSPQPYEICLNEEILYPEIPYDRKSVQGKKIKMETKFSWGHNCNSNKHIQISTTAERTRKQQQWEVENMERYHECNTNEDVSPIQCYEYLRQAGFMSKYSFNIKYNNIPVEIKNVTSKIFRALKTYYYWNTDVAEFDVHNPSNQIKAVLRIDPQDRTRVNVTVKAPSQNVTMTDIYTPMRVPRLNVKRTSVRNFLDELSTDNTRKTLMYSPICQVHSNNVDSIETFDGHRFRAPLTTCWSVLAKDCSEEQRFAVLMKKVSKSSERKAVKIVTPEDVIEMRKSGSEFIVKVNDEKINIEEESSSEMYTEEHKTKKCFKTGPYMMCRLPEAMIRVYYDGFSAHIKISNLYVGKQCGLCGHMNYEPTDDFQTPQFESTHDIRKFQQQWIYKDEECQVNTLPDLNEICPTEDCVYEPEYETLTSQETSAESPFQYHNKHKKHPEPRKLNRVVHKMGKTCFSKEPMNICPEYAQPKEATQQEVDYGCLDEMDTRAEELSYAAMMSPIPEARELSTEFTRMEIVPTSCKRYRTEYEL